MLLCVTGSGYPEPVIRYCKRDNLYCDVIDAAEFSDIKTALSRTRALTNYDFIVFYYPTASPSELPAAELLDAAGFVRRFYHARMIFIAPDHPTASFLFAELGGMGLRELVPVSEDTDLEAELAECLSPDGKSFADVTRVLSVARVDRTREYIRPRFVIPDDLRLTVGVAGTQSRAGVTTQAFSMYHAFAALGFTPCIVDVRQSFIESLLFLYGDEAEYKGSVIGINGMDFSADIQSGTGHNVFLYDLGELDFENADEFRERDMRILCAGAKPWELPAVAEKDGEYGESADVAVFSFASEREQKTIEELGLPYPAVFAPWNPDIWSHTNKEWHEQLLVPFLERRLVP